MRKWRDQAAHENWQRTEDCSWWYGERASVSQLAGAAWSLEGGWAMQERPSSRAAAERGSRAALIDLWIRVHGFHVVAEAKQVWPVLDQRTIEASVLIETALRDIGKEFQRVVPLSDHAHVSLVFIAPRLRSPGSFDATIGPLVDTIKAHHLPAAWTFPNWARTLKSKTTDYYYPGVALLARIESVDTPIRG